MLSTDYVCRILSKLEFLYGFSKNTQISNLMKNLPVGAQLFYTNGQTDMQTKYDETNSGFRKFANAFKKQPHGVLREGTAASFL